MARPRKIDRDAILQAAETVLHQSGAAALSFASIAAQAGLSKASVQSVFGTRDALIDALIARWMQGEGARYADLLQDRASDSARLRAHLDCTLEELHSGSGQRVASLLAVLAGEGRHSAKIHDWYKDRLGDLTAQGSDDRHRRILYLAAEGAYFLRCIVGLDTDDTVWQDIFADLQDQTGDTLSGGAGADVTARQ